MKRHFSLQPSSERLEPSREWAEGLAQPSPEDISGFSSKRLRQPEVEYLHLALWGDFAIGGFQIAMNDTLLAHAR